MLQFRNFTYFYEPWCKSSESKILLQLTLKKKVCVSVINLLYCFNSLDVKGVNSTAMDPSNIIYLTPVLKPSVWTLLSRGEEGRPNWLVSLIKTLQIPLLKTILEPRRCHIGNRAAARARHKGRPWEPRSL